MNAENTTRLHAETTGITFPGLVLIHGAMHAADCWDLLTAELAKAAPALRVLTVDLPGRRTKPGDLNNARIADWADSVVADINAAGFGDVVVAGHSIAGLTVPKVIAKLGPERVCEIIFIAAVIPTQGWSSLSRVPAPLVPLTRLAASAGKPIQMPGAVARLVLCNGMTRAQRRVALSKLHPESSKILIEAVDRSDMPTTVRRTWIMTGKDRTLSPRRQHDCIDALGGVDTLLCIDTCHDAMISEPKRLAAILAERCRL
ncbi:alpha/beta fold hydrolase [Mycobacterium conspicuum]|nr:alpha/beta hydrolase [Mycobacterium conspicuum]